MSTDTTPLMDKQPELRAAVEAAHDRKAGGITLLDLSGLGAFTGAFLICTGFSSPQVQAIADGIDEALDRAGHRLLHREGYDSAEWVLLDYGNFVVHVFLERARLYYDIERLWRRAPRLDLPDAPDWRGDPAARDGAASA